MITTPAACTCICSYTRRPSSRWCSALCTCDPLAIPYTSNHSPSTNTMSQVSHPAASSTNFETNFAAALAEYQRQTTKNIASHPLAAQLKSCESPSAILAVLRAQVQIFDKSQGADEKLTKWLDPT